jgi:hypothetical protein
VKVDFNVDVHSFYPRSFLFLDPTHLLPFKR